ncbi:hypothetical protein, partial [Streptomyces sp. MBT60]|uniref:hypothetical protein n=1 Tax=Streptomyces sp. MBT60 TaxID=2800409 RepID=UPI001F38512B
PQEPDPAPEDWRAVLASWDYPDDARTGTRRQRRQAKRQHRQDARRHTADWVREERRRDPIRPGCALVGVLLVLAVGAGVRYPLHPRHPGRAALDVGRTGRRQNPPPAQSEGAGGSTEEGSAEASGHSSSRSPGSGSLRRNEARLGQR